MCHPCCCCSHHHLWPPLRLLLWRIWSPGSGTEQTYSPCRNSVWVGVGVVRGRCDEAGQASKAAIHDDGGGAGPARQAADLVLRVCENARAKHTTLTHAHSSTHRERACFVCRGHVFPPGLQVACFTRLAPKPPQPSTEPDLEQRRPWWSNPSTSVYSSLAHPPTPYMYT